MAVCTIVDIVAMMIAATMTGQDGAVVSEAPPLSRQIRIPWIDLNDETGRQVIVDREAGQYLGHPTTVLLEDGRTMIAVYPTGHGRGAIVMKRSADGGLTWSDRLPTPESWATSLEVPTLHRVIDPKTNKKRLIMWSGLYPARLAFSEDDGATWSELEPVSDWGGIVVMGSVESLKDGSYLAMFHDDGRFFTSENHHENPPTFTLYKTFSRDGGLTWTQPEAIWSGKDVHLCEPGVIRSPDGSQLAALLRENSRTRNSWIIFSDDEGQNWSTPRELPASLSGDRHTAKYAPDGRLFISFRDMAHESPTYGDWVGWVGTYDDLVEGREGQYRIRLKDNLVRTDCAYPGVEVLPDGTFAVTTYGHWDEGEQPYILSMRFTLDDLDQRARVQRMPPKTAIVLFDGEDTSNLTMKRGGGDVSWPIEDGAMIVNLPAGDIITREAFGDCLLHVEWLSPPGGTGQGAGNSGVKLQERYEIQILNTPGPPHEVLANEAGAIYSRRAPDGNPSTGPNTWQSFDIKFTAPRWHGDTKIANARMTVYWNGVLVHDDVALPDRTGVSGSEAPGEHPILFQAHASAAEGQVRFRNIWVVQDSD